MHRKRSLLHHVKEEEEDTADVKLQAGELREIAGGVK